MSGAFGIIYSGTYPEMPHRRRGGNPGKPEVGSTHPNVSAHRTNTPGSPPAQPYEGAHRAVTPVQRHFMHSPWTFAAYILIRGILYPFIISGMSTAQVTAGGVLQVLIAAGMTPPWSAFLPRPLRLAPAHDSDYPLRTVGHRKHPRHERERLRPEHWPVHHDCEALLARRLRFIFVLMPAAAAIWSPRASGEEAEVQPPTLNSQSNKPEIVQL